MVNDLADDLRGALAGSNAPAATVVRALMGVLCETALNSSGGDVDLALSMLDQAFATMSAELRAAHQEFVISMSGGRN